MGKSRGVFGCSTTWTLRNGPTMQGNWRPWIFRLEQFVGPDQDSGSILDIGQDQVLGPEPPGPCKETTRGLAHEEG